MSSDSSSDYSEDTFSDINLEYCIWITKLIKQYLESEEPSIKSLNFVKKCMLTKFPMAIDELMQVDKNTVSCIVEIIERCGEFSKTLFQYLLDEYYRNKNLDKSFDKDKKSLSFILMCSYYFNEKDEGMLILYFESLYYNYIKKSQCKFSKMFFRTYPYITLSIKNIHFRKVICDILTNNVSLSMDIFDPIRRYIGEEVLLSLRKYMSDIRKEFF